MKCLSTGSVPLWPAAIFFRSPTGRKNLRSGALRKSRLSDLASCGFTLVEVVFAMLIVGFLIVGLYTAIAYSVSLVRTCQENERVTQILSGKLDTIRLYNWTQITNSRFVQTNFTIGIDPLRTNSISYYTGRVAVATAPAPLNNYYGSNLLQVTVTVDWMSGPRLQSRSMNTYVAKYGIQTYIMR